MKIKEVAEVFDADISARHRMPITGFQARFGDAMTETQALFDQFIAPLDVTWQSLEGHITRYQVVRLGRFVVAGERESLVVQPSTEVSPRGNTTRKMCILEPFIEQPHVTHYSRYNLALAGPPMTLDTSKRRATQQNIGAHREFREFLEDLIVISEPK